MGMRASRMRILCPCPEVPTLHAGRGAGGARGVVAGMSRVVCERVSCA
jgi:hypothetical protein